MNHPFSFLEHSFPTTSVYMTINTNRCLLFSKIFNGATNMYIKTNCWKWIRERKKKQILVGKYEMYLSDMLYGTSLQQMTTSNTIWMLRLSPAKCKTKCNYTQKSILFIYIYSSWMTCNKSIDAIIKMNQAKLLDPKNKWDSFYHIFYCYIIFKKRKLINI